MRGEVSIVRLQALLKAFADAAATGDSVAVQCNGIFVACGEQSSTTTENQRCQAVIQYLFNSKVPCSNVAVIMLQNTTFFLHSDDAEIVCPNVENHRIVIMSRSMDWKSLMRKELATRTLGVAVKELEIQDGTFAPDVIRFLRECGPILTDATGMIGELLFEKDAEAQKSMEKAAGLCSTVFRRYVQKLLVAQMSRSAPSTLDSLRHELCDKLMNPQRIEGLEKLAAEEFSVAGGFPPCIFNQSVYDGDIHIETDRLQNMGSHLLFPDVLIVRYGFKHFGYTAFIGRTFLVEPNAPAISKVAYDFAYSVSEKVISSLMVGKVLKDVYRSVIQFAQEKNYELSKYLPKSLGFSTGLLVLESRGSISEKGTAVIKDGMCFIVRVLLENADDHAGGKLNIELSDTVIVRNGGAELRTKLLRTVDEVVYEKPEEEEEEANSRRDLTRITRQGISGATIVSRESQREEKLRQLLQELYSEYIAAGGKKGSKTTTEELTVYEIGKLAMGDLSAASSIDIPSDAKISVKPEKRIAWLPLYGKISPFHISTITKVETKREGSKYIFIITFGTLQENNVGFRLNRTKAFLKELTFTANKDLFTEVQIAIQKVQQDIKNEDANRKKALTTVSGGKLHLIASPVRLPQVKLRPAIQFGRKSQTCVGDLELHSNGLRFSFLGSTPIEILFDNVKHIIFQPADNSVIVCYHITLKKAILLGQKPTTEIQFIAEVMEVSEAATGMRRTYDEEVAAEERDKARVLETNKKFIAFSQAVERRSQLKTQLPTTDFKFDGVHWKGMSTFKASKEVLWAISEWPAFTVSVSDIEVASLERSLPGNSTFDLCFVLKDYNKPVISINAIPKKFLELIKDWCLSVRIYYMESGVNLNWKATLKDIRDDEEWNPWSPGEGWSVLNNEDDTDEDSDSESDSTYDEEEDEGSDDDSSWAADEESDISSASDSEDESSADWDELDRRAQEQDRKRNYDGDNDDRPTKRSRTASSSATAQQKQPYSIKTDDLEQEEERENCDCKHFNNY